MAVQFINRIKNWHFLNPSWRLSVSKRNQHWVADWLSPRWRHPPSSSPTGRRGGKAGSFSLSRIQTNYLIYSGEKNEDERVLKIFPDWAKTEMYLCLNNYWSVYFVNIASSVRLNIYSWGKNCSDAHYQIPAASTPHTTGINNPSKYLSFYKLSNWNIQNKGTIIWCPLNV